MVLLGILNKAVLYVSLLNNKKDLQGGLSIEVILCGAGWGEGVLY